MTTAMQRVMERPLPDYAASALADDVHPQMRTLAFHQLFDAPIHVGGVTKHFLHMDDQRVAFRAAFILSEAMELLEKGLGLEVSLLVNAADGVVAQYQADGSGNADLTACILAAMRDGGKRDVVEVVDALGDLNVVVNGFALELGANMALVDQEILASNFTKLDDAGAPIVSDGTDGHPKGKIIKGPNFMEPNIAEVLGVYDEG